MAIRAVNILIIKYRRITNSHWVTKVRGEDVFIYKSVHDDDSFEQSYSAKGIIQARPNYDENIVSYLRQSLVDNEPEFPFFHIYLDAENAFEQADYYLAVILSIVALESVVKTYLRIYS